MATDHDHDPPYHPEHRQGDVPLADGSRLFTCTKRVRDGARTSMLFVRGLFRVDVTSTGDQFQVQLRNISGGDFSGGVDTMKHRRDTAFDGGEVAVSEFEFAPTSGPVGSVRVSVARPASDRGERFPCTAIAVVTRRAA